MAEGNGERMQNAAESALLKLASRWGMVLVMATALPAGAWMGNRIIGQLDEQGVKLDKIRDDMMNNYLGNRDKINNLDVRLTGMERDVDNLKGR